jgi:hypothetical protein
VLEKRIKKKQGGINIQDFSSREINVKIFENYMK